MRYQEMLAKHGLAIGDHVVCTYRLPVSHQWWIGPVWVGRIADVEPDKPQYRETSYCVSCECARVVYMDADQERDAFTQLDRVASLRKVPYLRSFHVLAASDAGVLDTLAA